MKRCPVLLHLALIFVALFADDVNFIVQLPAAGDARSADAVHSDSSAPLATIRLVDAQGALVEVARNGRPIRDAFAQPSAGLQTSLNAMCDGISANVGRPSPASPSLVTQRTRLQI